MIISRWTGFEIDSSEGYFVFDKNLEGEKTGLDILDMLFSSPLIWNKVAFEISAPGGKTEHIYDHLADLCKKGEIEDTEEMYDWCPYRYACSTSKLMEIFKDFKYDWKSLYLNFSIAPLKSMPKKEQKKMSSWFIEQFKKRKEGKQRWKDYRSISEKDIKLAGNSEMTDEWSDHFALEGSFELNLEKPYGFLFYISAGDPSLMIYLLSSLFDDFELSYEGDHGISIDLTPGNLEIPEKNLDDHVEIEP